MKTLCTLVLLSLASAASAQTALFKVSPLSFSRSALARPVSVQISGGKVPFQKVSNPGVHPTQCFAGQNEYTAFFCRMEVKSVNTLHVWLKVHAGDYDSYTRRR